MIEWIWMLPQHKQEILANLATELIKISLKINGMAV